MECSVICQKVGYIFVEKGKVVRVAVKGVAVNESQGWSGVGSDDVIEATQSIHAILTHSESCYVKLVLILINTGDYKQSHVDSLRITEMLLTGGVMAGYIDIV